MPTTGVRCIRKFVRPAAAALIAISAAFASNTIAPDARAQTQQDLADSQSIHGKWSATYVSGWKGGFKNRPRIWFKPTGKVSGSTGCNTFHGSYQRDGSKLSFSQFGMTKKACPSARGLESKFIAVKNNVRFVVEKPGHLVLLDQHRKATIVLKRDGWTAPK